MFHSGDVSGGEPNKKLPRMPPAQIAYAFSEIHCNRLDLARLGVFLEIIKDRLPAHALHLSRVFFFRFKFRYDTRPAGPILENSLDAPAIGKFERQLGRVQDFVINCLEVETEAAVFRFHSVAQPSANAQVIFSARAAPIVGSEIPLRDVFRLVPERPHIATQSGYNRFNADSLARQESPRVEIARA